MQRLIEVINKELEAGMDKCKWIFDINHGYYDTECEEGQYFTDGGIKENHYKFCPYCGKEIQEIIEDIK